MASELAPAEVIDQAVARIASPSYGRWATQLAHAGNCVRPVRLRGAATLVDATTGQIASTYTTTGEPGGVLLKACQTRRATRCVACAAVYRGDARALILAGLVGGKGVDQGVAQRPVVFVTLTAPSFGQVHGTAGDDPRCSARSPGSCEHGLARRCGLDHREGDPALGAPVCVECYDYESAVVWNASAATLWWRSVVAARRALAGLVNVPVRQFAHVARLNFVKVVEYQRRGVVHGHALVRLDGQGDGRASAIGVDALALAVHLVANRVQAPNPYRADRPIRWGDQVDVVPVAADHRRAVAGYLAKYATKSTDDVGVLDHRLRSGSAGRLPLPDHLRRMVEAAWGLGGQPELAHLNLRRWAHTLGYRGHWLTKSQSWSTTFTALRQARHGWRLGQENIADRDGSGGLVALENWEYVGIGHGNAGETWLANSTALLAQQHRRLAWEEQR